MNSRSKNEVRRCRPLLGTFVEIAAGGLPEIQLHSAVNDAFEVIERIHHAMSVHDPASELSQLNRNAAAHPVTVSRELFSVLTRAEAIAAASNGAFDYTVAPTLAKWGFLPKDLKRKQAGNWRDVLLLRGRKVYFLQPLALDLGGIAKGFAVDAAIEALQKGEVASGIVNAGGDLRVFGKRPATIHLRHPAQPRVLAHAIQLRTAALATSSPCFTEKSLRGQRVSHLVNPATEQAVIDNISVSVRAPQCWLADALTKVVLNAPGKAGRLLEKFEAEAFMLSA